MAAALPPPWVVFRNLRSFCNDPNRRFLLRCRNLHKNHTKGMVQWVDLVWVQAGQVA